MEPLPQMDKMDLEFKEIADERVVTILGKIGQALAKIYGKIPSPVNLPNIFKIQGQVEVTKQPNVTIKNFDDLAKYFRSLEQKLAIWAQAQASAKPPRIDFPAIDFPKYMPPDMSGVISAIQSLEKSYAKLGRDDSVGVLRSINNNISELVNRPVMTPQPVTNISLNALQGVMKTTSATVGTSAIQLPSYGQLFNRRSVEIYNNSANTIYLGGSDVTTTNGMPVGGNSYSPIIDAGYNMIIYGISAQSGNNVRILEVSRDNTGNIQE